MPLSQKVELNVFDILGRDSTLVNEEKLLEFMRLHLMLQILLAEYISID
ncbi:MAG: hypothetical protein MZV64_07675 [Ignavibacteriales bacterium]|nr:hypothetical protein [Ignavibacteriales bacterium]